MVKKNLSQKKFGKKGKLQKGGKSRKLKYYRIKRKTYLRKRKKRRITKRLKGGSALAQPTISPVGDTLTITGNGVITAELLSSEARNTEIKNLVINGIISIPDNLFQDFTKLETLQISTGQIEIGKAAFSGCNKLQSVEITVTGEHISIQSEAFKGCTSLNTLTLDCETGNKINLSGSAFTNCEKITTVDLNCKDGIITSEEQERRIEETVFGSCINLKEIQINGNTIYLEGGFYKEQADGPPTPIVTITKTEVIIRKDGGGVKSKFPHYGKLDFRQFKNVKFNGCNCIRIPSCIYAILFTGKDLFSESIEITTTKKVYIYMAKYKRYGYIICYELYARLQYLKIVANEIEIDRLRLNQRSNKPKIELCGVNFFEHAYIYLKEFCLETLNYSYTLRILGSIHQEVILESPLIKTDLYILNKTIITLYIIGKIILYHTILSLEKFNKESLQLIAFKTNSISFVSPQRGYSSGYEYRRLFSKQKTALPKIILIKPNLEPSTLKLKNLETKETTEVDINEPIDFQLDTPINRYYEFEVIEEDALPDIFK